MCGHLRVRLELDVHVGLGTLLRRNGTVGAGHAVVEQHHVMLDHAEPLRFWILARASRQLLALHRKALLHISARAIEPRLLVVPENEPDRAIGDDIGAAEHASELHHQRRARGVIVRGLAPAMSVHVCTDEVHLLGMRAADFRAVHLLPLARCAGLRIEGAQACVGLTQRIDVHTRARAHAARAAASLFTPDGRCSRRRCAGRTCDRRWWGVGVGDALCVGAAVALELCLDPVHRRPIAIRALTPVTESGQSLDGRLVPIKIQPTHHAADDGIRRVGPGGVGCALCRRGCRKREQDQRSLRGHANA